MVISRGLLLVVSAAIAAASCGGDEAAKPAATPAVKVAAPVTEASLTTVTLTPEAEMRLGIQTVAVERKAVSRTRTVGAPRREPKRSSQRHSQAR